MSTEPDPKGCVASNHNRPTQLDAPESLDGGNCLRVNGTNSVADDETRSSDLPRDADRPSTPTHQSVSEASSTPSQSPPERDFRDKITQGWLDHQASAIECGVTDRRADCTGGDSNRWWTRVTDIGSTSGDDLTPRSWLEG
ncbi:hypothetical protein N657DRAFT_360903 [Parathielavia appendiculata]|uniref:Uncharacterized protein n=1 Tax=Parathielavia appendiculata TaxID=2587402 RepID=A0AAN6U2P0_9PEZI|nr:hypothetical protein N657DRAFT_360903 [Parathielavia appendiculata]